MPMIDGTRVGGARVRTMWLPTRGDAPQPRFAVVVDRLAAASAQELSSRLDQLRDFTTAIGAEGLLCDPGELDTDEAFGDDSIDADELGVQVALAIREHLASTGVVIDEVPLAAIVANEVQRLMALKVDEEIVTDVLWNG